MEKLSWSQYWELSSLNYLHQFQRSRHPYDPSYFSRVLLKATYHKGQTVLKFKCHHFLSEADCLMYKQRKQTSLHPFLWINHQRNILHEYVLLSCTVWRLQLNCYLSTYYVPRRMLGTFQLHRQKSICSTGQLNSSSPSERKVILAFLAFQAPLPFWWVPAWMLNPRHSHQGLHLA